MSENKKVKNATKTIVDGRIFKSLLEARVYKRLLEYGYTPDYEHICFNLIEAFYPKSKCYDKHYDRKLKAKRFGVNIAKVPAITYTPDFTFSVNDKLIVIECKGKENDVYPIKKKLFRRWVDTYTNLTGVEILYFEVHNLHELDECVEVIRSIDLNSNGKEHNTTD